MCQTKTYSHYVIGPNREPCESHLNSVIFPQLGNDNMLGYSWILPAFHAVHPFICLGLWGLTSVRRLLWLFNSANGISSSLSVAAIVNYHIKSCGSCAFSILRDAIHPIDSHIEAVITNWPRHSHFTYLSFKVFPCHDTILPYFARILVNSKTWHSKLIRLLFFL